MHSSRFRSSLVRQQQVVPHVRSGGTWKQQQQQRLQHLQCFSTSSRPTPRFQIPAHVAAFSLLFFPTVGFSLFYASRYGPSEAELESEIMQRYQQNVTDSGIVEKNQHVGEFLGQVFNEQGAPQDVQARLNAVLKGGKESHGRNRQFDPAAVAEKMEEAAQLEKTKQKEKDAEELEELNQLAKKKRKKDKKKKRKKEKEAKGRDNSNDAGVQQTALENNRSFQMSPSAVAGVAAVAAVAATVGFLAGGKRSS